MSDLKAKFTVKTKPAKATDPDYSRYALGHVVASPATDGVWLTASNGRIVAATKVEGEIDKARYVPTSVMPTLKRGGTVELNGQWQNDKGKFAEEIDASACRYPDVSSALATGCGTVVTLDAQLLLNLAQAICEADERPTLTLFLPAANKKGYIEGGIGVLGSSGIGTVMPCHPPDDASCAYESQAADYKADFSRPQDTWLDSPDHE